MAVTFIPGEPAGGPWSAQTSSFDSGIAINAGGVVSSSCAEGGSSGSIEQTVSFASDATDQAALWFELDNIDDYDGASGSWDMQMVCTTANMQVDYAGWYIYHVDSSYNQKSGGWSGSFVPTAGTLPTTSDLITANLGWTITQDANMDGGTYADIDPGDKIIIFLRFTNNQAMENTIGITPGSSLITPAAGFGEIYAPGSFPAPEGPATTYIQGGLINGGLVNTSLINDSLIRV